MNSLPPLRTRNQMTKIKDGIPTQYRLKPRTDTSNQPEAYRKLTFGARDKNKPHKTILMVGETGTGKTTLINVMVNYMLGVQREDKVWFEITDDRSNHQSPVQSQTSIITIYEFYLQESQTDLTIIDTPGYGDTRGIELADSLYSMSQSAEGMHALDAVCLVIKSSENRLSDTQIYTFDAVQSLFGRDIAENIVLLFTHSNGAPPRNAVRIVKEAKVKCAVNEENQPVFFLFDNCQSEPAADEEEEKVQEKSWKLSFTEMSQFFKYLENKTLKSLKKSQDVLQKHDQFKAKISELQSHVNFMKEKQDELKKAKDSLEQNKNNEDFEYEVEVTYKEKVNIDTTLAKMATCCTVCEENCHYPGCWWASNLSLCSVMNNNHCRVCTNKCHYSKHVKENKIYVTKIKKEKKSITDLKTKYDVLKTLVENMKKELQKLEKKKKDLVIEAFQCVEKLQEIALIPDSLNILLHVDFLVEILMETHEYEKINTLESIKKRSGGKKDSALQYIRKLREQVTP